MGLFCTRKWEGEKGEGVFSKPKDSATKLNLFVPRSPMHKMSYYDGYEINEAKLTQMVRKIMVLIGSTKSYSDINLGIA